MPVVAVVCGGSPTVILGSRIAYLGMSDTSLIAYFSCVSLSLTTAARVVSLPDPAVVGIAYRSGMRLRILSKPFICLTFFSGRAARAPTTFARSIGEPPPKATIASHSPLR